MKKLVSVLAWCLLVLLLLLPAARLLCSSLGYSLTLTKAWIYGLGLTALSAGTLVAAIAAEDRGGRKREEATPEAPAKTAPEPTGPRVFYALLPASVLNGVSLLRQDHSAIIALFVLATVFNCGVLNFEARRSRALRSVSLSLAGVLSVPLVFLGALSLLFGGIAVNTVVQRLPSPDGSCYAELIDNDQGGLGGSTFVEVCPRGLSGEYGLRISQQIYAGRWGEFYDMELSWKDETCLEINGKEYPIP